MVVWGTTRLDIAMKTLQISALELSKQCGVSNSLISRWRSGKRRLTMRSVASVEVAATLVRLDAQRRLDSLLTPLIEQGHSRENAMWLYLLDENLAPEKSVLQIDGYEYRAEQRVLFGKEGLCKAADEMLERLERTPVERDVIVCVGDSEVWNLDEEFEAPILERIRQESQRGRRLILVEPQAPSWQGTFQVSLGGLVAMLQGNIRRYSLPHDSVGESFGVVIPGYWFGRVVADPDVADGVTSFFTSDPRIVAHEETVIERIIQRCDPQIEGEFFQKPGRCSAEVVNGMSCGAVSRMQTPVFDVFSSISRIPFFGLLTRDELTSIHAGTINNLQNQFNDWSLALTDEQYKNGQYRIILDAEELVTAVAGKRGFVMPAQKGALNMNVVVPQAIVRKAIERIVLALRQQAPVEVALVSREFFEDLHVEMAVWKSAVSVVWLQDGGHSFFSKHQRMTANLDSLFSKIWETLPTHWKNQERTINILSGILSSNYSSVEKWLASERDP